MEAKFFLGGGQGEVIEEYEERIAELEGRTFDVTKPTQQERHLKVVPESSSDRPPLCAEDGRVLPLRPRRGFKLMVTWGRRSRHWTLWTVLRVASGNFYVSSKGSTYRHPLRDWEDWLVARLDEGRVAVVGTAAPPQLRAVDGGRKDRPARA